MKIGILGAGHIGGTLGRKWVAAGHEVRFGVRHTDKPEVVALVDALGKRAAVGTASEAIDFGEVILFAIPGSAMEEMIATHGQALAGKIVIDAANRFGGGAAMNSADAFARHAPDAQVFRAFNSLGWEIFENPHFGDLQADLFYCGPEGDAGATVEQLIVEVGVRPVRVGDLSQVDVVDGVLRLWFTLVSQPGKGRHLAFKMLKR